MGDATHLRVAVPPVGARPGDTAASLAAIAALSAAAGAEAARLLVLPQQFLTGGCDDETTAHRMALLSDGPQLRAVAAIARELRVAIVCGYVEQCSGRFHDSALFVDDRGCALANYRRTHAASGSTREVLAVGQWLTVVPFAGLKVGILIGADIEVPEPARALALAGANILLVLDSRAADTGIVSVALLPVRAFENGCALAYANSGTGPAAPRSRIIGQEGELLAMAGAEIAVAALPPGRSDARMVGRRPLLYRKLAAPVPAADGPRL